MVAAVIDSQNSSQRSHDDIHDDDDGSWVKNTPKKASGAALQHQQQQQRVFIGNLPNCVDGLDSQLLPLLQKSIQGNDSFQITTKDIQVIRRRTRGNNCMDDDSEAGGASSPSSSCHAFVTCPTKTVADTLITALQGVEFQGRCLIVQAEMKQHVSKTNKQPNINHRNKVKQPRGGGTRARNDATQSNPFGKRSWVKPSTSTSSSPSVFSPEKALATQASIKEEEQQQQQQQAPPNSLEEASERIEALVSKEMKDAQNDVDSDDDALTAMIGMVAAVSLVAGLNGFGVVVPSVDDDDKTNSGTSFPAAKQESAMSFQEQCRQQSISALMEDYGEFDPSWKEQQQPPSQPTAQGVVDSALETTATTDTITDNEKMNYGTSRLGQHGKAPIHVELTSFGYKYGAPGASKKKQGWSHAQPLAPFDCRDILQPVPSYLAWRDGLNGQVKRALLSADKNYKNKHDDNDHDKDGDGDDSQEQCISVYTQDIANEISKALLEAINEGGYGYAMPLKMVVYVGSELGRHRSVVACELAATALRKLLRANYNDCFQQPCSVGTRHLHLDKKQSDTAAAVRSKKKNCTDDDSAYENNKLGKM